MKKKTTSSLVTVAIVLSISAFVYSCSKENVSKDLPENHQTVGSKVGKGEFPSKTNRVAYILKYASWYQYYNSRSGDHFYTTVKNTYQGYIFENIAAGIFSSQQVLDSTGMAADGINLKPILRYWNGSIQDHFYTTDAGTYPGYVYEGTDGYLSSTQSNAVTLFPVYRYWNPNVGDHYYTTTFGSYSGYLYEGILGYALTSGQ